MSRGSSRGPLRHALVVTLAALGLAAGLSAPAQAAGISGPTFANRAGTYNGRIEQAAPRKFTGHIHFVVTQGRVIDLKFTAGTMCGVLWTVDRDHSMPTVSVKLNSTGLFSYKGEIAGRLILLEGAVNNDKAVGTFFQAFPWGQLTCTMGQAALFTASHR